MGSTRKLWLLILLGGCVLMLQYHVSSSWSAPGPAGPALPSSNSEGLVQAAVSRLQLDTSMAHTIGKKVERFLKFTRNFKKIRQVETRLKKSKTYNIPP